MGFVIDGIIILIFALFVFLGYKRGLIGVAFKILSFLAALVIAFVLYKPVAEFIIDNTTFDEQIENAIIDSAKKEENLQEGESTVNQEESTTSKVITDYINEQVENISQQAKEDIANSVARDIAVNVINGISLISLFIVAKIVLLFAKALSDLIAKLPLIKQFNKIGGTLYGILEGLLIIYLVLAIISFIAPMIETSGIPQAINQSIVGSYLYNNNLLLKIIF
ncbi:MAG: CvpA family protein [Clostridia bacterium]